MNNASTTTQGRKGGRHALRVLAVVVTVLFALFLLHVVLCLLNYYSVGPNGHTLLVTNETNHPFVLTLLPVSGRDKALGRRRAVVYRVPANSVGTANDGTDLYEVDFRDTRLIVWAAPVRSPSAEPQLFVLYWPQVQKAWEKRMSGIAFYWGQLVLRDTREDSFVIGNGAGGSFEPYSPKTPFFFVAANLKSLPIYRGPEPGDKSETRIEDMATSPSVRNQ